MTNILKPVSDDQQINGSQPEELDLDALAAKIVELLMRELEIETERAGKVLQGR